MTTDGTEREIEEIRRRVLFGYNASTWAGAFHAAYHDLKRMLELTTARPLPVSTPEPTPIAPEQHVPWIGTNPTSATTARRALSDIKGKDDSGLWLFRRDRASATTILDAICHRCGRRFGAHVIRDTAEYPRGVACCPSLAETSTFQPPRGREEGKG